MYDDEDVNPVSEEEILKLSGGGDWHTAYVLFYGPRLLQKKFLDKKDTISDAAANAATNEATSNGAAATTNI
jgi:hypothetical protein